MSRLWNKLIHAMSCEYWVIAYRKRVQDASLLKEDKIEGFRLLPQRRFVTQADPFLLYFEGKNWLFYEKQNLTDMKGTLWCQNLDDLGEKPVRVLEEEFHLSYPQIFLYGTYMYMLPETRGACEVRLYRCERFPDKWVKVETLLDIPAVDTTILSKEMAWLIPAGPLAAQTKEQMCCLFTYTDKHLEIYSCKLDENCFHIIEKNKLYSSEESKVTRPGGAFLAENGRLLRTAQNCGDYYGQELIINQIDRLAEDVFEEHEYCRLSPAVVEIPGVNAVGIHTYNQNEAYEVIDILHREISIGTLFKKMEWKLRGN